MIIESGPLLGPHFGATRFRKTNARKLESGRPLFVNLSTSFGGFSFPDLASTANFLHNAGVESFWGALCAEIGPSHRQVVQNMCKSVFLKLLVARFSFYRKFHAQWWCRKLLGRSVRRDRAVTLGSEIDLRSVHTLDVTFLQS